MQTLDFASGLHKCLEFSQRLSGLHQAMQTRKTFSIAQLISNAWLIHFHVTCATWIMLATLPDIFTNAFSHKRTQRLANNFWRLIGAYVIWMTINFGSFAIDVQSLNVLCTTCCLPKNAIHVSAQWPRSHASVWGSLFKNIFTHLFASAVNHLCFQPTVFYRSISSWNAQIIISITVSVTVDLAEDICSTSWGH